MNRFILHGVALVGLLAGQAVAQVQVSIDGQPPLSIDSDIAEISYQPTAKRLEVRTNWDDLRCVINPAGPPLTLPVPQPGDFVLALDSYDGDVLGEYVIESDGSINQLLAAIQGDPAVLEIVTSASRVANCVGGECANLVCAPGGTPVFGAGFEPIVADLGVVWETVPGGEALEIVGGGASRSMVLTASNSGQLDADSVFVDVDVLVPGDGSIPCPTVVSGGNGFSFDANCSGTWNIGNLPADSQVQMELSYAAASNAPLGALAVSDAVIDAPSVADINLGNNTDSVDLEVVREAELIVDAVSIPAAVVDLTSGPEQVNFSLAVDPARGPSDLNNEVEFQVVLPQSGDIVFDIPDADYDPVGGVWTPVVAGLPVELTGTMTVNSYEPGMQNFCFGIQSATPVDAGVDVFIAADSDPIRCLDVTGPETVALTLDSAAPATVIAGSSAPGPGNLLHTFTLTNDNVTFDGENIGADLTIVLPQAGTTIESIVASAGSITQTAPDTWSWSLALLPAGQAETVDVVYLVDASTAALDVVAAGVGNLSVDPSQVLSDPSETASVTTTVDREIDLVITSGESADPVAPGETLVYIFQASNVGPSDGSDVTVDLATVLPADVSVANVSSNFLGSYSNGVWTIPQLDAGGAIDASLTVEIAVGGAAQPAANAISGTATVTGSNETRINTGDDSATETTSISAI